MHQTVTEDKIYKALGNISSYKDCKVVHISEGVSTEVYRLESSKTVYYLRLKEEGESASAEVLAHKLISQTGARVPQVVFHVDFDPDLGRSFLITTEIKGVALRNYRGNEAAALEEAGKDLALINSIPVEKFGWIDAHTIYQDVLKGGCRDYFEFMTKHLRPMFDTLVADKILSETLEIKYFKWFERKSALLNSYNQAFLAHGDFDPSHIYQEDGVYTGIIDFGDIRATSCYHDLSHFYAYSPENFEYLVRGYRIVTTLPVDYLQRIELEATMIALGKLWWISKNLPHFLERIDESRKPVTTLLEKVIT